MRDSPGLDRVDQMEMVKTAVVHYSGYDIPVWR